MSRLLHRQLTTPYPTVARGEGVYLYDTAGKRYLDASGGAAVSCLGHGHAKVVAAIKAQLDDVAYAHTAFFTSRPAEALAEWLVARAPAGFGRAAFVSGGSEAVEGAMKLARQIHLERGEREDRLPTREDDPYLAAMEHDRDEHEDRDARAEQHDDEGVDVLRGDADEEIGRTPDEAHRGEEQPPASCHQIGPPSQ